MAASRYCGRADLYNFGLPRGSIPNSGRLVLSTSATADAFTLGEHGFSAGDPVTFRAEMGGSMPAPLIAGTTYYALPVSESVFQVAATAGGPAIDLTTAGAEVLVSSPLPIESAIEWGAETINLALIAHAVPLEAPYPPIIVMVNAELAAAKLGYFSGATSKSLTDVMASAQKKIDTWAKGVPLRGSGVSRDDRTNTPQSASVPYCDRRGWGRFGGL